MSNESLNSAVTTYLTRVPCVRLESIDVANNNHQQEALSIYNIDCTPESSTLRFSVNYLAGGTIGYYAVEGCEGAN